MYVKGNTILHVNTISKLKFGMEKVEHHENAEEKNFP